MTSGPRCASYTGPSPIPATGLSRRLSMAWNIEVVNECAVVRMNTNKVNVQNEQFFGDLHGAFDRLEREFSELPVVLTGQGHAFAGGLITALDCDFRVAARKPAKFGLNEVPIGIPMPAAYVEIIKYTLGDQVGALTTLRGKLYDFDEAERLGFFHEVVEPDQLIATAIDYARCITPDCNTAYAMSKKALQDSVMRQIQERTVALDAQLPVGMSDEGNRRAQDRRRQEIMHKR